MAVKDDMTRVRQKVRSQMMNDRQEWKKLRP